MDNSKDNTADSELVPQPDGAHLSRDEDEDEGEGLAQKVARFLRRCWLKRKMVFTILAIGISISLVKTKLDPNVYTSTTTFTPPDTTSSYSNLMNMMGSSNPAASLGSEMLGLETPGELYVSILDSRNVLDGLVGRFD